MKTPGQQYGRGPVPISAEGAAPRWALAAGGGVLLLVGAILASPPIA